MFKLCERNLLKVAIRHTMDMGCSISKITPWQTDCMAVTKLNSIRPHGEIHMLVRLLKVNCQNMCNSYSVLQLNFYTIIPVV